MWPELLWAMLPKKYLITAAAIAAVVLGGWATYAVHVHTLKATYFDKGAAFARDSAREATIVQLVAVRDSAARTADSLVTSVKQRDSLLHVQARTFTNVTERRHIVISADSSTPVDTVPLVGVTSEASGKHWLLPRDAALEWQATDSLLSVAAALIAKYRAANADWAKAYASEHNARIHSDSALALALSMHSDAYAPPHGSTWKRDVVLVIDGVLLAKYGPALLRGLAHLHPHL